MFLCLFLLFLPLYTACVTKSRLISGVGLNLDNVEPTTCLNAVLQELISTQHKIKREEFLSAFFNKFEDYFETFLTQGTCVCIEL